MQSEEEENADSQEVGGARQLLNQNFDDENKQKTRVYENEDCDLDAQTNKQKNKKIFRKINYKTKRRKCINTRRSMSAENSYYEDSSGIEISHYPSAKSNEIFQESHKLIAITHDPAISDSENLIQTKNRLDANDSPSNDFMLNLSAIPSTSAFSQQSYKNSVSKEEVSLNVSQLQPNCNRPSTSYNPSNYHTDSSSKTNSPRGSILHSEYDFSAQSQLLNKTLTLPDSSRRFPFDGILQDSTRQSRQSPLTLSRSNPNNIYHISQAKGSKSCPTCCAFKNKWIILLGVLLAIVCLSTIGNLCYFFILKQSSITGNSGVRTENPATTRVFTTTVLHGLKGELSQIQFCGAYPASYIYAFDAESPETTASKLKVETTAPTEMSTNSIGFQSISTSNSLVDRSPDEPIVRRPRVVGGRDTPPGTVPWQASLWVKYRGMACGGSVIMKNWILTAAHCTILMSDPLGWDVYVGMTSLAKKKEFPGVRRNVIKIIQHEKYRNDTTYDYDIGLLKLENDLEYSEFIQPICVPPWDYEFPDGMTCYVSGWGTESDAKNAGDADILQRAKINIIGRKKCKHWYKRWLTERMLCAGEPEGGKDACEGDSGGPLSCYDPQKDVWMLAGTVSWGEGCGKPQHPGGYTKISYFSKWIWTNIGKEEGWIPTDAPIPKVIKQEK